MKTIYFSSKKLSIYTLFGLSLVLLASCGTTQNTSYYDNDGIYGSTSKPAQSSDMASNNKYKEYFSSLNQENQEIFTDVDNYTTPNDSINRNASENTGNNGWGSNPSNTTVIVYDNFYGNNWGWNNWGWGWNNWYGPGWNNWGWNSWGWGWNNWYGPGWNNWGWNNGYYTNYAFANGRRDTRYTANNNRYEGVNRNTGARNQSTVTPTRYNTPTSRSNQNTSRDYNSTSRPRSNTSARPNNSPSRNYNNSGARPNTNTPSRNNTNTTPATNSRDFTPTKSEPTRSYSPSSGGGGRSFGGGGSGGGRSSGGGGGRR